MNGIQAIDILPVIATHCIHITAHRLGLSSSQLYYTVLQLYHHNACKCEASPVRHISGSTAVRAETEPKPSHVSNYLFAFLSILSFQQFFTVFCKPRSKNFHFYAPKRMSYILADGSSGLGDEDLRTGLTANEHNKRCAHI
jgi:hypothetical protein